MKGLGAPAIRIRTTMNEAQNITPPIKERKKKHITREEDDDERSGRLFSLVASVFFFS